jgi:hypothetical protein
MPGVGLSLCLAARFILPSCFPVENKTTKVDLIIRKSQNAQWVGLGALHCRRHFVGRRGGLKPLLGSVLLTLFSRSIDQVPEGVDDDLP